MKQRNLSGTLGRVTAVILMTLLTLLLLAEVVCVVWHPSNSSVSGQGAAVADQYRMAITNLSGSVLGELAGVKKTYWIGDDAVAAPKPNPSCFGTTGDSDELAALVEKASELLDGQTLYFDPYAKRLMGSQVAYYYDETILSISWKVPMDGGVYTFTEVKIAHPSQFRRFLSGGQFGSGKLYLTSEMAASVNAVSAFSGDYYAYRWNGITVVNGEAKRVHYGLPDCCYVDDQGDLLLMSDHQNVTQEEVETLIQEKNIRFSLSFGPNLVINGVPKENFNNYPIGQVTDHYSRAALCQMDKLHYLVADANAEEGFYRYPSVAEFAKIIASTGCQQAYTLDGGQTATTVVNNRVFNHVSYGSERLISDIFYFATAIPEGE